MAYTLTKDKEVFKKSQYGIDLCVFPPIGGNGVVVVDTQEGHYQEFYHKTSSFNYIVLEGSGSFFLDDEEVKMEQGDMLSIQPGTRIYYKGTMKLVLITSPAWTAENEVETRAKVW